MVENRCYTKQRRQYCDAVCLLSIFQVHMQLDGLCYHLRAFKLIACINKTCHFVILFCFSFYHERNKDLTATHGYGWKPSLPDHRDYKFSIRADLTLPPLVDLRDQDSPIEDQGQLGSCTSFAAGAAFRFDLRKQGLQDFVPSHLFEYYNSRAKKEKSVDSGATIRGAIKAVNTYGICPESEWPYDISKFASKPPTQSYKDALQDRALKYQAVSQNITVMKNCLAQGLPFVIGISVYQSFESQAVASTGKVPLPKNNEQLLGGHALLCLGYRDKDLQFIVRNSWGSGFGDGGYVYLPYAYLMDSGLSGDFWVIQTVGK